MSIYSLVASEHAPNLNDNSNKDLYKNKLVSSATIKASEVVMPSYGDLFGKIPLILSTRQLTYTMVMVMISFVKALDYSTVHFYQDLTVLH